MRAMLGKQMFAEGTALLLCSYAFPWWGKYGLSIPLPPLSSWGRASLQ